MSLANPYENYLRNAVTTAKPEDLTLMLYQGMVKFIRLSKAAIQKNDIGETHKYNLKAQDILSELMVTLKEEYAVADTLLPLYDFMKRRLIEANRTKNAEILEEVEGFAMELLETWSNAMKQYKSKS